MRPNRIGLWLFLGSLLLYNVNMREISSADTMGTRLLPLALIQELRLDLDSFFRDYPAGRPLPYWVQHVRGHYLSSYPILPALMAVPVYLVPLSLFTGGSLALVNVLAKLSATVFAALSVLVVYLALRQLARPPVAAAIAFVYAVGTSTWSVSSQGLWGHGPAQLFMAAGLYGVLRAEADRRAAIWTGIAAGLMVASRPTTGLPALAFMAYLGRRDWRQGAVSLLGFLAVTLPVTAHNLWYFGSVQGGYAQLHATHALFHGVGGAWTPSVGAGLLGILVSPSRGLLVYSPVLAFALAGLILSLRDAGPRRPFFAYMAAATGGSVVMLGTFAVWWGGHSFGPRLLTDVLPLLALFLVPVWPRLETSRLLTAAFLLAFVLSIGVQVVGVFYYPSPRRVDWNWTPQNVDFAHERLWDWQDTQILRLLRNGPRSPGFESVG